MPLKTPSTCKIKTTGKIPNTNQPLSLMALQVVEAGVAVPPAAPVLVKVLQSITESNACSTMTEINSATTR